MWILVTTVVRILAEILRTANIAMIRVTRISVMGKKVVEVAE